MNETTPPSPLPTPPSPIRLPPSAASWIATGLGLGLWLPAPGTVGAAVGSLLAWGIGQLPGMAWQIAAILAVNLVGIPICTAAGRALGGKKDNQAIILDEITSVPLVFLFVAPLTIPTLVAGFLLHRVFDISKPPPARQLERLPEGLGVMADDWAAAIYACAVLHLLIALGVPLGG